MKFVSKFSNHRVVLQPGMPAEPLTGRASDPGISVRFENGSADVHNEEVVQKMLDHPRFGRDFLAPDLVEGKGANKDPFKYNRRSSEPDHSHTKIEYGHIGKATGAQKGITAGLSRDKAQLLQKAIDEQASKKALEMAPELAKQLLKDPKFIEAFKNQIKEEAAPTVGTGEAEEIKTTLEKPGIKTTPRSAQKKK